jgi:hypothetical protein
MRITNRFVLALCLLGLFLFAGCAGVGFRNGPPFDLGYTAPLGEPVYIEQIRLGKFYSIPPGILGLDQGWERVGKLIVLAPPYPPFPQEIFVRWFNYKQQRFYEATVPLREDALQVYRDLPKPQYGRRLIVTGVLPDGQAVVWVASDHAPKFGPWVEVGRVQGRQAEGDPDQHRNTTAEMRERGEI